MRGSGMAIVALAACTLSACHREPTFDERYASAQDALGSEAAGIDAELAARASEAAAAGQQASATTSPTPN